MRAWFHGGTVADGRFEAQGTKVMPAHANKLHLGQVLDGKELAIAGLDARASVITMQDGGCAYGIAWKGDDRGALPEYFVEQDGALRPVDAKDVPRDTGLVDAHFRPGTRGHAYTAPRDKDSVWWKPGPVAGPFTVRLGDGSEVEYWWYRFADQPAMQRFPWTDAERTELQRRVELVQRQWAIDGTYLAPVSRGSLAAIEPQQIVTPPKGLEVGFVPIAVTQRDAPPEKGR
ncbi:MAG: hypothetical protein U1F36_20510 [Planctomycetota bacterium]